MAIKTSVSHPLQIAELPIDGGGAIGVTFCPGKKQPAAMTGPWDRDLALDLDVVQAWGADAVVTLMEAAELDAVQVADIGERVEARGLEWHHLPIRDVDVPDARFEAHWLHAGLRLRRRLRAGGRVLVHCRGGLGRAGTVAARLLAELGQAPDAAIAAVRRVRRGAIETAAQERHVQGSRPPAWDEAYVDRLLGCLLAGAVGDGFGYTVEFMSLAAIRTRYGVQGLREPVYQDGRLVVSDDTQMTLFTLEGMLRAVRPDGGFEPDRMIEEIRLAYLDWLDTQGGRSPGKGLVGELAKAKALRVPRAPGNTCLSALRAGGRGSIERPINDSKGCGAAMRVAPLGLLPLTPAAAFTLAGRAGALSHGHVDGWSSGALLAAVLVELVAGRPLAEAAAHALEGGDATGTIHRDWRTAELARRACELARDGAPPAAVFLALGQGWTGEEALAIGLWAALGATDLRDAIARGANHDGDSDSTASIAGQLYGAWRGVTAVPQALARRLDVLDPLLLLAQRAASIPTRAAPT